MISRLNEAGIKVNLPMEDLLFKYPRSFVYKLLQQLLIEVNAKEIMNNL